MPSFVEFEVSGEAEPRMICFYSTLHYRLNDGSLLWVEQEVAWCEICRAFGSAEVIPSLEELRERIVNLQTPSVIRDFILRAPLAIRDALAELLARLHWRAARKSPARCLVCGSTAIVPVRFDADRTCFIQGRRLTELAQGFADTADRIAQYTAEGIVVSGTP